MDTIIVYADDALYAQPFLQAMAQAPSTRPTHWIIVACAPRITHRVSKFVSNRARENWRNKWADKLYQSCVPTLQASGNQVSTMLAKGPLHEVLQTLQEAHGTQLQVVDLRRPKQPDSVTPADDPVFPKLGRSLAALGAAWTVLIGETLAV